MRFPRVAWFLLASLFFCLSLTAQQPPQRDLQAVSILTQSPNAVSGIAGVSAIQDFAASGTITYYWAGKEVHGNVSIRGRGAAQFRLDATLPEGTRSWVVSNGAGSLKESNGNATRIPYHNAINLSSLTLPSVYVVAALYDPTVSISYVGLTKSGEREAAA